MTRLRRLGPGRWARRVGDSDRASLRAAWDDVPKPDAERRLRVQAWRQADGRVVWEPRPTSEPIRIVMEPGSRLAQHAMGADRVFCRTGEMRGIEGDGGGRGGLGECGG